MRDQKCISKPGLDNQHTVVFTLIMIGWKHVGDAQWRTLVNALLIIILWHEDGMLPLSHLGARSGPNVSPDKWICLIIYVSHFYMSVCVRMPRVKHRLDLSDLIYNNILLYCAVSYCCIDKISFDQSYDNPDISSPPCDWHFSTSAVYRMSQTITWRNNFIHMDFFQFM